MAPAAEILSMEDSKELAVTTVQVAPGLPGVRVCRVRDPTASITPSGKPDLWAFLWAASVVFAQTLVHPAPKAWLASTPKVLEIGCGSGLASLAAALSGAAVVASDYVADALSLLAKTASLNGLPKDRLDTRLYNWNEPVPPDMADAFDLVVGCDVIYMGSACKPVARTLSSTLCPQGVGIVVDPGRANADDFESVLSDFGLYYERFDAKNILTSVCALKNCHVFLVSKDEERSKDAVAIFKSAIEKYFEDADRAFKESVDPIVFGFCAPSIRT